MLSNHLILCCPLLPSGSLPVSQLFSIRWPKCWSFNFSISPSNEYSVLISFKIDWFEILAIQGTLKSLLQGAVSHSYLRCCLLDCSPYFAPNKTWLTTLKLCIFFGQQLPWPTKWPRVDFLPLPEMHKEPELWDQQRPLVPICLLREGRQICNTLSLFLKLISVIYLWVKIRCLTTCSQDWRKT